MDKIKTKRRKAYFIAEVSSNHDQSLERCFKFIEESKNIGCDAVKFQLFQIDSLYSPEVFASMPEIKLRRKWELPLEFIPKIRDKCRDIGIDFGCTPFYIEAVEELLPYVDFFKIASYEILWLDLVEKCFQTGKPLIVSTGMANEKELTNICKLALKYPDTEFSLLHCASEYPVISSNVNLSSIKTMRQKFGCRVGWSDHSQEPAVIFSAFLNWSVDLFECHIDLDGKGAEFDKGHCWLPGKLKDTIKTINMFEETHGDGKKRANLGETKEREWRADPIDGMRPLKHIRSKL